MRSIKTITNEAILSSPSYISAVLLVGGSAASTLTLNDSADGGGTDRIGLKAAANITVFLPFPGTGITFDTAVYSTITGSGAVAYIYFR